MPGLVEIWSELSKASKNLQETAASSYNLNMGRSTCDFVSRQGADERKVVSGKIRRSASSGSESEAIMCMLLMDRFAPS